MSNRPMGSTEITDDRPVTRHPSTEHMMLMLNPNPNLKDPMRVIAEEVYQLAVDFANTLPDSPELTSGLRKLLEAKDCFVRAAVFSQDNPAVSYKDR